MNDLYSDRIAEVLRERTPGNGHVGCDALDPCDSCRALREIVFPQQRQGQ